MNIVQQLENLILVGYNLNEISKYTGINRSTLSKIIKNKSESNSIVNFKIHDFFMSNIDQLELKDLANIELRRESLINTPDGWQKMNGFVEKGPLHCYKIITDAGETVAADKHLFQLANNEWLYCDVLQVNDKLLTVSGEATVLKIEDAGIQDCYDITINHNNHRYYLDNISSHNTGKSLLAALIMSNALKAGYDAIFYFDSEGGGSKDFFENTGCDTSKIEQILVSSVEDAQIKILETFNMILEIKKEEPERKFLCVLDSLGALVADKVLRDADKGKVAAEMGGRAKQCLFADTLILMADNTFKPIKDVKPGDKVITHLNKIKEVKDNFTSHHKKYIKLTVNNETIKMSLNHKLLISRDNELFFCEAQNLQKTDKIISFK